MATSADQVDSPCLAYKSMEVQRQLIDDQWGGTTTMRLAGERWLPKEEKELQGDYNVRLSQSIHTNQVRDTIRKTCARPYAKPLKLKDKEKLPERLQPIERNADRNGTTLTAQSHQRFTDMAKYGLWLSLAEHPSIRGKVRRDEMLKYDIRPYFCRICPTDLIGWETERDDYGRTVLTQIRIVEMRTEKDGNWGQREVKCVRVLERDNWRLYKQGVDAKKPNEYTIADEGPNTLGEIPLVVRYAEQTGYLTADPPYEDMAWVGVAYWQSNSDQRNLLHVCRVPILTITGMSEPGPGEKRPVVIGRRNLAYIPDGCALSYTEAQGVAMEEGRLDLKALQEQMEIKGLQPFISRERSGDQTATGKAIDEGKNESSVERWVRETEEGELELFNWAAKWDKAELPEDFAVDIDCDSALSLTGDKDVETIKWLKAEGLITRERTLYEVMRRVELDIENVPQEIDKADQEQAKAMAEAARALGDGLDEDGDPMPPSMGKPPQGKEAA